MTDTEDAIYDSFAYGNLRYLDAIQRLEAMGYEPKEAERIVDEWADGLEPDHDEE